MSAIEAACDAGRSGLIAGNAAVELRYVLSGDWFMAAFLVAGLVAGLTSAAHWRQWTGFIVRALSIDQRLGVFRSCSLLEFRIKGR